MAQFAWLSPSGTATSKPGQAPTTSQHLAAAGALHDLNNLLLIMATNASLAAHHLPVEHPVYSHIWAAGEAVSQAAWLAQQLRNALE